MNVTDALLGSPVAHASAAVITLKERYTHADLRRAVGSANRWLERVAMPGDRVLLCGENSFFWIVWYLAALRAGCTVVPLATTVAPGDIDHVVATTAPTIAVLETRRTIELAARLPSRTRIVFDAPPREARDASDVHDAIVAADPDGELPRARTPPTGLAALMFTSGSTGTPRGVKLTHDNLVANTESILGYLPIREDDRAMVVLPFYYCYGASLLHTHLAAGAAIVLDHRFMFPDKVLGRMLETECTSFAGVPSHFQILLRKSSFPKMRFPRLRFVQQAGGRLADPFVAQLAEHIAPAEVFVMYGQTEATARISHLPPRLLERKRGSIGRGIPGVTLRVVDADGNDVRPGVVGEIVARGRNVAAGYWMDEAATKEQFVDGALRTGDLATVDEDGFVFIVDRARDFVKCGGVRVASRKIEDAILESPHVTEVAVVAIGDELAGEAVEAHVVFTETGSEGAIAALHAFCTKRLAPDLVPKRIVARDELPKNAAGKVLKRKLREGTTS